MSGFITDLSDYPEISRELKSIYKTYFPEASMNKVSDFRFRCDIIFLLNHGTNANSLYRKKDEQEKLAKMFTHLKDAHEIYLELHPNAKHSFCIAGNKNLPTVYSSWKININDLKKVSPFWTRFDFFMELFFVSVLGRKNYGEGHQNITPLDNIKLSPKYDKSAKQSENRFLKAKIMETSRYIWEQNKGERAPTSSNDTNSPFENFLRETLICAGFSENINLKDVTQAFAEYYPKS